jgi:hypothetical protein
MKSNGDLSSSENTPQQLISNAIRRMQAAMRQSLDPGVNKPDRETLSEIYGSLDDERFNAAVEQLERPN